MIPINLGHSSEITRTGPSEPDLTPANALIANKPVTFLDSVPRNLVAHKEVHRVVTKGKKIRHSLVDVLTVARKATSPEIVQRKGNRGLIGLLEAATGAARKVTHLGTAQNRIKTDHAGITEIEMILKMVTIVGLVSLFLIEMVVVDTTEMIEGENLIRVIKGLTNRGGLDMSEIGLVIAMIRVDLKGLRGVSSAARKATLPVSAKARETLVTRVIKDLDLDMKEKMMMAVMPEMARGADISRAEVEEVMLAGARLRLGGESTVLLD
jgi:hypothetical protein